VRLTLGNIDMEIANRIAFELLLRLFVAPNLRQPRHAEALKASMQRRTRQMMNGRLEHKGNPERPTVPNHVIRCEITLFSSLLKRVAIFQIRVHALSLCFYACRCRKTAAHFCETCFIAERNPQRSAMASHSHQSRVLSAARLSLQKNGYCPYSASICRRAEVFQSRNGWAEMRGS
jgi:hypothetical protein